MPGWLSRLDRVLPQLNVPGLDLRLEGNSVKLGGWLSEQDRDSVLNSLKTALVPGFRFGYLRDEETELAEDAHAQNLRGSFGPAARLSGAGSRGSLNEWVIRFPEGSAEFPEDGKDIAARAAELLKTMGQPVIWEIGGHTDNQGNAPANLKLSLERAIAVREVLMQSGVPEQMLQIKGMEASGRSPLMTRLMAVSRIAESNSGLLKCASRPAPAACRNQFSPFYPRLNCRSFRRITI